MEKIGTIIRNHRISQGMTQEELGSKVFVSKQAVSKWETGRTLPDIETVRKLCEVLKINKDEILGGSMEETRKSRRWSKILAAVGDPEVDEFDREYAAFGEEVVILFERFQGRT